jgi:hypothetical protein
VDIESQYVVKTMIFFTKKSALKFGRNKTLITFAPALEAKFIDSLD